MLLTTIPAEFLSQTDVLHDKFTEYTGQFPIGGIFETSENENFRSSLCIANFQLHIFLFIFCYRDPETCKKQRISCEICLHFLIFGGDFF